MMAKRNVLHISKLEDLKKMAGQGWLGSAPAVKQSIRGIKSQ